MELRAAEILARLRQRRHEMRMLGACQRDHSEAMRKWRKVLLELVRWTACRNEMDFIEIEPAIGGARHHKMSAVDGIERAAKQGDAARMMFRGGAVRLRCRQCASQRIPILDFLMNCRLPLRGDRKGQLQRRLASLHPPKSGQGSRAESCRERRPSTGPVPSRPRRPRRK